ncbi:MAG: hypothetical protein HC930_11540 [Hydrococcus sp. SU_1_0]|nr:hypothetical protein [Hydrococcus sp. SU_1_0]
MTYRTKRPGREDTIQVGVRVPVSIKEAFAIKCEVEGDTPASVLRRCIYQYLKGN